MKIYGKNLKDEDLEEKLKKGNLSVFTEDILSNRASQEQLSEIETCYNEIFKLEKSIREVCDLFESMELLIGNQGDMIDNIEKLGKNHRLYIRWKRGNKRG